MNDYQRWCVLRLMKAHQSDSAPLEAPFVAQLVGVTPNEVRQVCSEEIAAALTQEDDT